MAESTSLDQVRAAKEHAYAVFSKFANVVGVGITTIESGYALKINLSAPPKEQEKLPQEVDGVPIQIEIVGRIRKRSRS
jgi:hypothetical protein